MQIEQTVQGLTQAQQNFVKCVVDKGYSIREAARRMGLPDVTALLDNPKVTQAITLRLHHVLKFVDAPKARATLRHIMDDPKASHTVRSECAKALLNRAGYVPPKAKEQPKALTGNPSEMSGEELRIVMRNLQAELAARMNNAKLIDQTPDKLTDVKEIEIPPLQVTDLL